MTNDCFKRCTYFFPNFQIKGNYEVSPVIYCMADTNEGLLTKYLGLWWSFADTLRLSQIKDFILVKKHQI